MAQVLLVTLSTEQTHGWIVTHCLCGFSELAWPWGGASHCVALAATAQTNELMSGLGV